VSQLFVFVTLAESVEDNGELLVTAVSCCVTLCSKLRIALQNSGSVCI